MIGKILVTVDGSDASGRAVSLACELAAAMHAELIALHVIRDLPLPPELREMVATGEVTESRQEILENSARIILERVESAAGELGVKKVRTVVENGDPGGTIVSYAADNGVDLIVMGSRGLGEVQSMLLGSVSRKVCNLSPISCLTVR